MVGFLIKIHFCLDSIFLLSFLAFWLNFKRASRSKHLTAPALQHGARHHRDTHGQPFLGPIAGSGFSQRSPGEQFFHSGSPVLRFLLRGQYLILCRGGDGISFEVDMEPGATMDVADVPVSVSVGMGGMTLDDPTGAEETHRLL